MKLTQWICLSFLAAGIMSCNDDKSDPYFQYTTDFTGGKQGWGASFTQFATGADTTQFQFKYEEVKAPVPADSATKKVVKLTALNTNGELFPYVATKVSGFAPNTNYSTTFQIAVQSNAPDTSARGKSYIKAGAVGVQPGRKVEGGKNILNLNKGTTDSTSGTDLIVLGNIKTGQNATTFKEIQRSNQSVPYKAKSNDKGELWVIFGLDSRYKGANPLYIRAVQATFIPTN
ncbi:hypothetical protein [Siphonobacter aquaeclarae]|jgi:hypothetical protein|uniref:Uncharacterized protein n=1 Tax=Siphonobacter aquaeclarae TaxID=563176 RepID=A0A1G9TBC8_9BACT|nr:hypothetical protein [Siphonobacter aquaeclarae]MBO9639663.1 hypothetical protein [Siphonobacter aquaeclarae]SDM44912.1 hypothetical protein SAMN04488090_3491 [Siphonobacter aquaeclarae]